jgi:NAD(P)-dependent dehydrogenase (short-subunit alcohol dehydrogenase family)
MRGMRVLVVGASSGIGKAFAAAAGREGARVAVAARRLELLNALAVEIGGSAYQLDITDPVAIDRVANETAAAMGGFDVVMCSTGVLPFAHIEHINPDTWTEAFAVNTVGPTLLIGAALPHLSKRSVVVVATSDENRRTRAGTAAYSASKAALDQVLRSWRCEHPNLRILRVALGPTDGTEILRGADEEVLATLVDLWAAHGLIPEQLADVNDVADQLVSLVVSALATDKHVIQNVQLAIQSDEVPQDANIGANSTGVSVEPMNIRSGR